MIFTCNPNSLLVHLDFNVNLKYLNGFDISVARAAGGYTICLGHKIYIFNIYLIELHANALIIAILPSELKLFKYCVEL